MKKILLAALFVMFVSSLCFAQQSSVQTLTETGKIDSIMVGDSGKGIKSQLAIVNDGGKNVNFAVSDETSIKDKDGKAITVVDLKKGDRINIVYAVGKKVNRAQSIKLVPEKEL